MAFHVAGFAEHAAACELDQHRPGRFDVSHPVGRVTEGDGGDSRLLHQTLNQTHGLMTFGSNRHQDECIDLGRLDAGNKFGDRFRNQADDVVNVAEAVICLCQLADDALFLQFNEALKGKDDVEVLLRQAVVVVSMGNAEVFLADISGDFSKGCVAVN